MKTDKILKLIQQKKAMRSGGALPLPKAQGGLGSFMTPPGIKPQQAQQPTPKAASPNTNKPLFLDTPVDEFINIYDTAYEEYRNKLQKLNTFPKLSGKTIDLTAGRYRGAKVPIEYLNMIVESAKRSGVDPLQSLAQAARETTFLQDSYFKDKPKTFQSPRTLVSGWNLDEEYQPYTWDQFLADKKVPGIKSRKNTHGWFYDIEDPDKVNQYIQSHPELKEQYIQKIKSTPELTQTNFFDLYHDFVKRKGIKGYNPGDPDYVNKVNKDIELLQSDPEFMKYYKQAVKQNGGLTKAQTGLPTPYLNPATVQAVLAKANQPVTNTLGRVISTPASREKERREKVIAKNPSKYSIEDYKQGIKEPGADNSVLSDPIAMAAALTAGGVGLGAYGLSQVPRMFLGNLASEATAGLTDLKKLFTKRTPFKSEIDWGKWNSEIPSNQALMQEYNAIEQTSKANGTWMKNPDGSAYQGTPEQFVQENSENFKKAFPKGYDKTYRGSQFLTPRFDRTAFQDKDIITFGTSDESVAKRYATNHPWNLNEKFQNVGKDVPYFHPDINVEKIYTGQLSDVTPGVYELLYPKGQKIINAEGQGNRWFNVKQDDVFESIKQNNYRDFRTTDYREYFDPSSNVYMGNEMTYGNVATDDIAEYMIENNIPVGKVSNVYDGRDYFGNPKPADVTLLNTSIVPVKSRWYNNGMFDMTNPNIYKAVILGAIIRAGALQQSKQKKNGGLAKAQPGGGYYMPHADVMYLTPEQRKDPAILEHEKFHRLQNQFDALRIPQYYPGPLRRPAAPVDPMSNLVGDYYNRRNVEQGMLWNEWESNPNNASFSFVPPDLVYDKVIDPWMYDSSYVLPAYLQGNYPYAYTSEAEAQQYEDAVREGRVPPQQMLSKSLEYQRGGSTKVKIKKSR